MIRKLILIILVGIISSFCISGCKGKEEPTEPTVADYKEQADKQITEKNVEKELSKLEKEVEADK